MGLHVTCDAAFRTQPSYSSQKSCVKIWFGLVEPFKSYHLNFPGGGGRGNPLLGGLHVTCNAHFRTLPSYSSQKSCVKIWFGLVEPFKLSCPQTFFQWGRNPLLGGLHLTSDAHFQTRMSYSSQKSCVKIWFGFVEIGGMLMLRGAEGPLLGGGLHVTCDAHFRTYPSSSSQKSCVKNCFGLVKPFKSYCVNKKKKSQTRLKPPIRGAYI